MALTTAEISFLQRLVTERPEKRQEGATAEALVLEHRIGRRVGRSIEYADGDFERAERLLRNAGQALQPMQAGASRSEMARRVGMSEKSGASRPHANSIACKPFAGVCRLGGEVLWSRPGSYQVLTVEDALQVEADVLMVVENLEALRWIERSQWIDSRGKTVLAVFRGDAQFSNADVMRLLEQAKVDVWVFSDFDPAGLWIAASVPRLKRLVLPDHERLAEIVRRQDRSDLYASQLAQYRSVLEACTVPEIRHAWTLMKRLQMGLPQEWMQ